MRSASAVGIAGSGTLVAVISSPLIRRNSSLLDNGFGASRFPSDDTLPIQPALTCRTRSRSRSAAAAWRCGRLLLPSSRPSATVAVAPVGCDLGFVISRAEKRCITPGKHRLCTGLEPPCKALSIIRDVTNCIGKPCLRRHFALAYGAQSIADARSELGVRTD